MPNNGLMWQKKRKRAEKTYHRVDHHKYFRQPLLKISLCFFLLQFLFATLDFCYLFVGFVQLNSRPFVCNIRFIFAINFSVKLYAVVSFDFRCTDYRPPHWSLYTSTSMLCFANFFPFILFVVSFNVATHVFHLPPLHLAFDLYNSSFDTPMKSHIIFPYDLRTSTKVVYNIKNIYINT